MKSVEDNESLGDFGVSLIDLQWLANQLSLEYAKENDGEKISSITALQMATGASYTASRMWLSGDAVPRRVVFIDKIVELIEARYPRLQVRLTKADAALFDLIASELEVAMGPHGSHLAQRLRSELVRCRALLEN